MTEFNPRPSDDSVRFALTAAGIGAWDLYLQEERIVIDQLGRELLGISTAEENDKAALLGAIHSNDRQRIAEAFNKGLLLKQGYTIDLKFRNSADERWLHVKGQSFADESGNIFRFSGVVFDISAEMQANEKRLAAESLAQLALEGSDAGWFSIDLLHDQFSFSPSLAMMLTGKANLQATRDIFVNHIHPDDIKVRDSAYAAAAETGRVNYEARFIWEDGSVHWIKARGKYLYDLNRKPISFSGIVQDITPDVLSRKEQQKLLSLVEHSSDLIMVADIETRLTYINKAGRELLGIAEEEFRAKTIRDLFSDVNWPAVEQKVLPELLQKGKWLGMQWYRHFITGEDIPFEADAFRLDSPMNGRPIAYACVAKDLRSQLAARAALERSEKRFRSLIEEAPVATALYVGKELIIEVANEQMLRFWGKDKSVIGMPLAEAISHLQRESSINILTAQFSSGLAYHSSETKVELPVDGRLQTFYFKSTYKPFFNAAGEVYAILNMAVDISEQVLNRKNIQETSKKLETAVDIAKLGTWEIKPQENSFVLSDRMKMWMGYEPGEAVTMEQAMATIPDRTKVEAAVAKATDPAGDGLIDVDYHLINSKTSKLYVMHARGQVFFNAAGEVYLIVGTTQDITMQRQIEVALEAEVAERTEELAASNEELTASNEELAALNEEFSAMNEELQEANENLIRSNHELEQYAYVASHDLQEPLRKIRIYSDMLGQQQDISEQHLGLVKKIDHSAQRMSMLIKDLLEFSRLLETGGMVERVSLNTVLQNVTNDFELVIEDKKATVSVGELPVIDGIKLQMNQLFYNLLGNALKFVRPGIPPRVEVAARVLSPAELGAVSGMGSRSKPYYEITVKDNGIGFEQKYADQVFQVFKRLHVSASYPGSGIGLAMCKRIVLNHGGDLTVFSEPDMGTTFRIILPAFS